MKNSKFTSIGLSIVVVFFFYSNIASAQAPPPPGVPLDFGLSALVAVCVGYGAYRTKK